MPGRQNQSGGQEEKAGDRNGLRMGEGRIRTQQGLEHPLEQKPGETAREGQSQTVEREIDPGQPAIASDHPADPAGGAGESGLGDESGAGGVWRSSSSVVTPKTCASATSFSTSGVASPSSHLLTACRETPTFPASSSWDSLARLR